MPKELKVKVCGMREQQNILQLLQLPIQYIGHIFYEKSARYAGKSENYNLPNGINKVGVFVNASFEDILKKIKEFNLQTIQLHADESPEFAKRIHDQGFEVIKAFGIDEDFDWKQVEPYLNNVDYFLFDTKTSKYGGSGKTFNWQKLHEYPYSKPYFLSGGLSLENLDEALNFEDDRLIGLDLNSKFEVEPGLKEIEKLTLALKIIRNEQISSK